MRAIGDSNFVIALALMCVLCVSPWGIAAPSGGEQVTFQSADPAMKAPIPATLYRPRGAGPFPGIVLLHPCGGPAAYNHDWAAWLEALGYVAILPNSLSPRHIGETCEFAIDLPPRTQALDGLGALAYLRGRPEVIPAKIAVMGWSHGGGAILASTSGPFIRHFHPDGGGYQAAIALYPGCHGWKVNRLAAPLLLLIGGKDDWASPAACVEHATALRSAGAAIEWKVYPGAMHGFDSPSGQRAVRVPGHIYHLGYDAAAAGDAHTQVQRFLSVHLQAP